MTEGKLNTGYAGAVVLDKELLSRVLTAYGHLNENLEDQNSLSVSELEFDEEQEVIIAHVNILKEYIH